ncbi:MAG: hypothetical protein AAB152_17985 [Candidatus Coatesbacteria bacterium]
MTRLEEGLRAVAEALDQERLPYMLIGGAAAILWGSTRTTMDADVTVWIGDSTPDAWVPRLLRHLKARTPDPVGFAGETRVLPATTANGLPVDIVFGQLPFEEEAIKRAATMDVAGYPVKVCGVADLILHKVISGRPRDEEDVRFLIGRHRATIDRPALEASVRSLSDLLADSTILSRFLSSWS